VLKKTKHIINGYKRKEISWKREKTEMKNTIIKLKEEINKLLNSKN
jgi:hypothetical protein